MIKLSYSSLNMIHQASHNWLNKQMGFKPEERPEWKRGKEIHRIVQDHLSGKKPDKRFAHIKYKFPIVEEVDFDSRCKFEFPIKTSTGNDYLIRGYYDGIDLKEGRFLEIKSGDPLWSIGKFQKAMQRKLYALSNKKLKEAVLVTLSKDEDKWKKQPAKVYKIDITPKDYADVTKWIFDGIGMIESGKFDGGLDENGKCTDKWCYFGNNCQFK